MDKIAVPASAHDRIEKLKRTKDTLSIEAGIEELHAVVQLLLEVAAQRNAHALHDDGVVGGR